MRKLLSCLMVALAVTACAPATMRYGNFVQKPSVEFDSKMADDAVKNLVRLYPPASTRFNFKHAALDDFGSAFVKALRASGYAIKEFKEQSERPLKAGPENETMVEASSKNKNLILSYVVDQPASKELFRLTLEINQQQLSRAYQIQDGTISPAGYWVRKEQ